MFNEWCIPVFSAIFEASFCAPKTDMRCLTQLTKLNMYWFELCYIGQVYIKHLIVATLKSINNRTITENLHFFTVFFILNLSYLTLMLFCDLFFCFFRPLNCILQIASNMSYLSYVDKTSVQKVCFKLSLKCGTQLIKHVISSVCTQKRDEQFVGTDFTNCLISFPKHVISVVCRINDGTNGVHPPQFKSRHLTHQTSHI